MKLSATNYKTYLEKAGALFLSAGIAVLITLFFLAVLAFAMLKGSLSSSVENIGLIVISVLSCFAGGFFCGKKNTKKRYLWGLATGLLYCLAFVLVRTVTGGTAGSGILPVTSLLYCAAGGMLGGMLS